MQEQIIVKPTYTGPRVIEVFLKKSKGHASLGRMISTYNKRFFVLDMNRLLFYYLPEKDAMLANATQIPLESISRIYVEHTGQTGLQEQATKGFVILTKKKAFKLLCDSQLIMEQLLFAFSNLIGAQSQKPLYDWNNYHTNDNSDSGTPAESPVTRRGASKEPSFNRTDYQTTMQQRRESNNRSPVRGAYSSQNSQEYQNPNPVLPQKETVIKTQSKEMNIVEEKKSVPQVETRNTESEQPVQHQISPKSEVEESKPVQEIEVERSSSPSQQEKERRSPPKENQQARGRTSGLNFNQVERNPDHMVEIQSLDLPSKSTSDEAKNVTALSSRQLQSFRRSSATRQKVGGLPTNVSVARIENVNSVPVKVDHETKVITKISRGDDDATIGTIKSEASSYMSKSDPVSSLSRKSNPRRDPSEGYAFSPSEEKRTEEVIDGDMPLSYLDIMKLKKKEKSNPHYQPEIPSSKYQANVNEDWDDDLFGDGKLSPPKSTKKLESNYNSQYLSQPNQSSAQILKLASGNTGRKVESAIGKTETFAVRGFVHNDWDDDL